MKTAQGLLGHSDSRLTLDHYAQVVTELSEAAAAAMGARFLGAAPRDERAMEAPQRARRRCAERVRTGIAAVVKKRSPRPAGNVDAVMNAVDAPLARAVRS